MATEEYGAKFFANGAAPGGVLEHPGTIKDPQRVKDSWNKAYQGSSNAHRVAVLEEGMKYQQIAIAPDQAQDRKSTRLNSSHVAISYAVFCLKKKKKQQKTEQKQAKHTIKK